MKCRVASTPPVQAVGLSANDKGKSISSTVIVVEDDVLPPNTTPQTPSVHTASSSLPAKDHSANNLSITSSCPATAMVVAAHPPPTDSPTPLSQATNPPCLPDSSFPDNTIQCSGDPGGKLVVDITPPHPNFHHMTSDPNAKSPHKPETQWLSQKKKKTRKKPKDSGRLKGTEHLRLSKALLL